MNRKSGFTLVELLVVMAIIAILAAIVVPNVVTYIERARVTRALSEIESIENSFTAMLADAQRGKLGEFLEPAVVHTLIQGANRETWFTRKQMDAAIDLYTKVGYALLQFGRSVLAGDVDLGTFQRESETQDGVYDQILISKDIFNKEVVRKLGQSYLPEIGNDSWGNDYRMFIGPWTGGRTRNPIIFRKFAVDTGTSRRTPRTDLGIVNINDIDEEIDAPEEFPEIMGYPADANKTVYIWSFGGNMENSQMLYTPATASTVDNPLQGLNWYDKYNINFPEYVGGGDDINNWDPGQTWQRFYR